MGFVVHCAPGDVEGEQRRLLDCQEELLVATGVPCRVTDVPAGELARASARTFACEVWLPHPRRHRRVGSVSNCTTYQARRLAIRCRDGRGRVRTAATVTGSLELGAWIAALLENHQREDGSVRLPAALGGSITGP